MKEQVWGRRSTGQHVHLARKGGLLQHSLYLRRRQERLRLEHLSSHTRHMRGRHEKLALTMFSPGPAVVNHNTAPALGLVRHERRTAHRSGRVVSVGSVSSLADRGAHVR